MTRVMDAGPGWQPAAGVVTRHRHKITDPATRRPTPHCLAHFSISHPACCGDKNIYMTKKIFACLLNSTAKPVQINIFAIFCLNCGSASTRPHHPSSSCSQERGAHRKCIKMTAVAGVAVGCCSLQTACSVIVRW